jgi:hypothetical protein
VIHVQPVRDLVSDNEAKHVWGREDQPPTEAD